jgi:hypothetical protein
MKTRMIIARLLYAVCFLAVGCTTTERAPTGPAPFATSVMEVPVIPDKLPGGQEPSISEASGDVQERAVARIAPGVLAPPAAGIFVPPPPLPGEFAMRTPKGYYLTAIDGGGRIADPIIITASTSAGAWEKFKLAVTSPSTPHDKTIQTQKGNYLTAVNGGGLTASALHSDATQPKDWERFRILDLGVGNFAPSYYAIQTIKGHYLTALGAGGRYADAIHTDAREIKGWEQFRIVKCGDPGSGYDYGIMAADAEFLAVTNWEGKPGFGLNNRPTESDMKYKLIRQSDGTYALQTANGRNYITPVGGGGQVEKYDRKYYTPDCGGLFGGPCIGGSAPIFHTDATQVKSWEKFRVIDQGNCTYAIQTASGFYVGIYKDSSGVTLLTTRRDGPSTANEKFQLVVFGLASPVVLQ